MLFVEKEKQEEKKLAEFLLKKIANLPNDNLLQNKFKELVFGRDIFKDFDDVVIEENGFYGGDIYCKPYQVFLKEFEENLPEDLKINLWSLSFFIFCSNSYETDRIRKEHRISNIYKAVKEIFEPDEFEPLLQYLNIDDLKNLITKYTDFLKDSMTDTALFFEDLNKFIIVYDNKKNELDWEEYNYNKFEKDKKTKVFDFYQFYLDLDSAVVISDLWKTENYRHFLGLYFRVFSETKSLLDKQNRDKLIDEFLSSTQFADLICNEIYKDFKKRGG